MQLKIRAYRAVEEPETCNNFVTEHRNVLNEYGISNVTTNNETWMFNPNVYCVIAETVLPKKIVGGLRLQVSDNEVLLPVELAIGKMDLKIHQMIGDLRGSGGVAELCALWNANSVSRKGLSKLIVRAGIAVTQQIKVKTLVCICAEYTLKMFEDFGFITNYALGKDGLFPYPNVYYKARVLELKDLEQLMQTQYIERQRILELIQQPDLKKTESGLTEKMEISYHLKIK